MRLVARFWLVSACTILSACGGGSSGVSSIPTPTPSPAPSATPGPSPTPTPTPTPASLSIQLPQSRTFATSSTTTDVVFRLADGIAETSSGSRQSLSVRYDTASGSYTIESEGRTQRFNATDRQPDRIAGEARYSASNEFGSTDFLTLALISYSAGTPNRYVGMGYWQSNKLTGTNQATVFHTFTYGFDTAASALPRSGFASWKTDIFGLLSRPGWETRTMEGDGRLDMDFSQGVFSTSGRLSEYDVIGSGGQSTLDLNGGGSLSSNGRFSGQITYGGAGSGSIEGSFYGPAFEELGANFVISGTAGAVLNGAMTGQRNSETTPPTSLTLVNVTGTEALPSHGAWSSGVKVTPAGLSEIQFPVGAIVDLAADAAQTRANFVRYSGKTAAGDPIHVDAYRPGPTNSELALTYTSFATWRQAAGETGPDYQKLGADTTSYLVYGIQTPMGIIGGMTGTANYHGLVYGIGTTTAGARYDIGGTSDFMINFSARRYSGSLELTGRDAGGASYSFGRRDFSSTLNATGFDVALLRPTTNDFEEPINPVFYGPTAQEIGATFSTRTGDYNDPATVHISGIAVAKRQ